MGAPFNVLPQGATDVVAPLYLSASEVVFHEEALYQVYVPLPLPLLSAISCYSFDSAITSVIPLPHIAKKEFYRRPFARVNML